jgi:hypothetical protein
MHLGASQSGDALKELSKVFIRNPNNTHWIGSLMTVEIAKGEPARNGKLASCWF